MSIESVRAFLAARAPDIRILETDGGTAAVAEAAETHGVEPARIAKTLSLKVGDRRFLLVARGDARMDNKKAKAAFGGKVKMLDIDEAAEATGHPVGGICPFGLAEPLPIYLDVSLRSFDEVLPAAGARNAAIRVSPSRLAELTGGEWVDVCGGAN